MSVVADVCVGESADIATEDTAATGRESGGIVPTTGALLLPRCCGAIVVLLSARGVDTSSSITKGVTVGVSGVEIEVAEGAVVFVDSAVGVVEGIIVSAEDGECAASVVDVSVEVVASIPMVVDIEIISAG